MEILKALNLYKIFQKGNEKITVLNDVSLSIAENEITVIVGASGAGKSTLLHILGALDRPDSGKIFYQEKNIETLSDERLANFRNRNIGFIFQFHHLLPEFTAIENVAIPQMINGVSLKKATEKSKYLFFNTILISLRAIIHAFDILILLN